MPLSINSYITQIVAGQGRKPSPIHDALQAIANWAAAGLKDSDFASDAALSESKLAAGIRARVISRQGGSASDWTTSGTTTQAVTTPIIQCGVGTTSGATATGNFTYSSLNVTFPVAFSKPPIVVANAMDGTGWCKINATTTGFSLQNWGVTSSSPDVNGMRIQWIAVGE